MSDKTVTIYVNTEEKIVQAGRISYAGLIALAFPGATGNNYIVKYYKGDPNNPTGTLAPGADISVKNGIDFRITGTGES